MLIAFLVLVLVASAVALLFALNTMWNLFRNKVPYVSTPQWAIDWLCANLVERSPLLGKEKGRGEVTSPPFQGGVARSAGVVYDLGCGDGRVLKALKQRFPHITAIGYERNWWPYVMAKLRNRASGVKIRRADFYQADLTDADVVFCFLIHSVMPRVERLLRSQLKRGATVYSYGFTFPTWRPSERIANPEKSQGSKLNVYRA